MYDKNLFRKHNPCIRFFCYFGLCRKSSLLLFSEERMTCLTARGVWTSSPIHAYFLQRRQELSALQYVFGFRDELNFR